MAGFRVFGGEQRAVAPIVFAFAFLSGIGLGAGVIHGPAAGARDASQGAEEMRGTGCGNLTSGTARRMASLAKADTTASGTLEKTLILVADGDKTKERSGCLEDERDAPKVNIRTKFARADTTMTALLV